MSGITLKGKVILLGDSKTGKTSLLNRAIDDEFHESLPRTGTVGFRHTPALLRGEPVRLMVWDTAGQEQYNGISSIYYRGASVAICTFDISNAQTFRERTKFWVSQLREYEPSASIILAANKVDLTAAITDEEIAEFCEKYSITGVCKSSSKTGEGVKDLFDRVALIVAGEPEQKEEEAVEMDAKPIEQCQC